MNACYSYGMKQHVAANILSLCYQYIPSMGECTNEVEETAWELVEECHSDDDVRI
jgi:hypothetical protein